MSHPSCAGRRQPLLYAFLSGIVLSLLTACGSGGGSGSSGLVGITEDNGVQVAGAAYQSVDGAVGTSNTGTATFVKAVATGPAAGPSLARLARDQIVRLAGLGDLPGGDGVTGLESTIDTACDAPPSGNIGTVDIKINDADNSQTLSSGDTLQATFHSCYSASDGQTLDGGFSLTGFSLSGDPTVPDTAWNAGATFSFTNLSVSGGSSAPLSINGGLTYSGGTPHGIVVSSTLSGSSVSVKAGDTPTITLQDFKISSSLDQNSTAYSESGTGRATDSDLGGDITFEISTEAPFKGFGSHDPIEGVMIITGGAKSSLTVTAGSSGAQLAGDTNGDGSADFNLTKAWSDLTP